MNESISNVLIWTTAIKLPLNEMKTKSLLITGKRLGKKMAPNDTQLQIFLDDKPLSQVPSATLLGLEIDQNLTFCKHTDKLCKKLAKLIGILDKIKCYLPVDQRLLYYNSVIKPVITYVSVVWSSRSSDVDLTRILRL